MTRDWNAELDAALVEFPPQTRYVTYKRPAPAHIWMLEPEYEPFIADGPALPRYTAPKRAAPPLFPWPELLRPRWIWLIPFVAGALALVGLVLTSGWSVAW